MKLAELRAEVERIETGPNNIPWTSYYTHMLRISLRRRQYIHMDDLVLMLDHAREAWEECQEHLRRHKGNQSATEHYLGLLDCHESMTTLLDRAIREGVEER